METKTNEIEKAITKTIANYNTEIGKRKKEIEYYQGGIKKLNETLSFFKKGAIIPKAIKDNRGGARPNAGRKKGKKVIEQKVKLKSKSKKTKVPIVNWDKIVIPMLEKHNRPMNGGEIVEKAFKGKHIETKRILRDRASTALAYMTKAGKLKSMRKDNRTFYGLPNMSELA